MPSDLYLYLDETGSLDLSGDSYFGLGQAMFVSDTLSLEGEATKLRFDLERKGIPLPKGFHAKNDNDEVKAQVFDLITRHRPRFDMTMLNKEHLPESVRREVRSDEMALYRLAWQKHFIYQAKYVLKPHHRVFVVAASLSEQKKRQLAAKAAINEVLKKYPWLDLTLCVWDSPTTWGLQVADYGLWAVQRDLNSKCYSKHFQTISPLIVSVYSPWEKNGTRKEYRPAAECHKRGRAIKSLIYNRYDEPPAVPGVAPRVEEETIVEDELGFPDDAFELDDPLGTGLWGTAPWSDDEPWTDDLEGEWDDIRRGRR